MSAALPKAPKIYPIHLLMTTNYRLPNDVDRYLRLHLYLLSTLIIHSCLADAIWNDI